MLKEIHEQPVALRQSLAGRVTPDGRIQAPEVDGLEDAFRRVTRVELVACGTASYAALVGAAAIQDWTGLPARVTVGSEFRYSPPPLDGDTLVIAVTQSGETADTIAPDALGARAGLPDRRGDQHRRAPRSPARPTRSCSSRPARRSPSRRRKTFVTQVTTLIVLAAAIAKARGAHGRGRRSWSWAARCGRCPRRRARAAGG